MAKRKTIRGRKALLHAAQRAIRERYPELGLSLIDIAEDVGCSPRQIQRVFRELGDTDFRSFLLRVRMEQAYRLLSRKKEPLPIRRTAPLVGYSKASGLRQAFLRFYGCNPSEVQLDPPDYNDLWREKEVRRMVD